MILYQIKYLNRNEIAKKGYELIQIIEKIPASIEQTEAVTAAQDYINLCLKELKNVGF